MPDIARPFRKNPYFIFRRYYRLILIILFALAVGHRWSGIAIYPAPHTTDDEYDNLWSGVSQIEGERPIGWSLLSGLPQKNLLGHYRAKATVYPIYRNYVDHPPLFQLVTGITAKAAGVRAKEVTLEDPPGTVTLWFVKMKKLRILPLILFAISFVLLWKWLRIAIGPIAAILSLSVFSFVGNFVLHHRLVVADNMVVPLMLGIFLVLEKWKRARIGTKAMAASVFGLAAAAVLSKLVALILVPGVVGWALASLRGKKALVPIAWAMAGALAGVAIYAGYACLLDKDAFFGTMKSHSGRFKDFYGIAFMIANQQEVHLKTFTLWVVAGWIFFFTCAARPGASRNGLFAAGMGLVFGYVFFAPQAWHGWHMVPFFYLLAAGWGVALRTAFRKPAGLQAVMLLFLLTTETLSSEMIPPSWLATLRYSYIGIGALLFFPWGFRWDSLRRTGIRLLIAAMLLTGLFLQVYKIRAFQVYWEKEAQKAE